MDKSVFEQLNSIDVNDHTEQKNGLTYLSWAWAWSELKKKYPDASYTIERFGEEKKPYLYDKDLGYMVFTSMTIGGLTHEMWLPVMDSANKAMKNEPYTYDTKWKKGLKVEPATMFDINKTIMRCLVKNISMFGLGLYIYAGEDLPEEQGTETKAPGKKVDVKDEIGKRLKKLIEIGVDVTGEGAISFIKKYNHGKIDINEMNDQELLNYVKVLDQMLKMKGA